MSIAGLAGLAGIRPPNALREVNRLIGAGLLNDRRVGRTRLVAADVSSPYHQPLAQILARSFGPVLVIRDELAAVPGIDKALIFGSWAARFLGHVGQQPRPLSESPSCGVGVPCWARWEGPQAVFGAWGLPHS